jgi:hypothetical protein
MKVQNNNIINSLITTNNVKNDNLVSNNENGNNKVYISDVNNFEDNTIIDNANTSKEIDLALINNLKDQKTNVLDTKELELKDKELETKGEGDNYLHKFLKKFSKKVFVKTLTKVPYAIGGYLGADKVLMKTLKWGAPILELPFAYKDYKAKLQEGKSKKEALLQTGGSFVAGNLVAFGIGSVVGGPIGLALSVVGGALAGTLTDKLIHKALSHNK